ncbi:hypothetical protein RU97_GL001126 [Enterococcus canis]|uniref:ABC3 transporter permease protein domain-containing protein n=1 Tax=Enterococcus canis TaxID=214095 RepID=A0A1L8RIM0_9ENTE|nr:FtsX-like permease family protein [Enterococcus canis]OJG19555.1 hypothetical protein RU97_GL001126 [Enterococcus canis]
MSGLRLAVASIKQHKTSSLLWLGFFIMSLFLSCSFINLNQLTAKDQSALQTKWRLIQQVEPEAQSSSLHQALTVTNRLENFYATSFNLVLLGCGFFFFVLFLFWLRTRKSELLGWYFFGLSTKTIVKIIFLQLALPLGAAILISLLLILFAQGTYNLLLSWGNNHIQTMLGNFPSTLVIESHSLTSEGLLPFDLHSFFQVNHSLDSATLLETLGKAIVFHLMILVPVSSLVAFVYCRRLKNGGY